MANNVRDFTVNSLQQFYNKLNNDILPTYASMTYVESAYAYILNEIVDNEYVIAQTFNSHNDRITTLENAGYITSETQPDWNVTNTSSPAYIKNKPTIQTATQSDWSVTDTSSAAYIKNKPTIPTKVSDLTDDVVSGNYLPLSGGYMDGGAVISIGPKNYGVTTIESGKISIHAGYFDGHRLEVTDINDEETGGIYVTDENLHEYFNNYDYTFPKKSGTVALTSDIPSIAGLATETYVNNKVAGIVNSAPETLDTLNELAAALGNDANFSTTVATQIGERVSKTELTGLGYVTQTTLSAQGYLTTETKANWNETNSNSAAYIQNKPELIWQKGNGSYSVLLPTVNNYDTSYAYGNVSVAHGQHVTAYGNYSHAEGINTFAGQNIILRDIWDVLDDSEGTHAEGLNTVAFGSGSHAEGYQTYTRGYASHAEGLNSYAYGQSSHAEGEDTVSFALSSHAEGRGSYSAGEYSHAEGNYTNTYNTYEHAEGVANVSIKHSDTFGDSENTQFTIGIGEVKYPANNTAYPPNVINRKNAISVMQNGYAYFLNVGNYDGTNLTSAKPLHTVLNEISSNGSSNVTESTVSGWGFTKNAGTITGITMNGSSKGTSGVVDLGTVLTAHQDISGKQDTITDLATIRSNASAGAAKVSANNSTITIQKGGTNVDTFTTNAASNKTINIPNELPTYSSSDAGKVLSINSSGQLVWITPVNIYSGTGEPNNSMGNDGDIYLQQ